MKNFKKLFASIATLAILASAVPTTVLGAASYSDELQGAYDYAYGIGITTQASIDTANMYGSLIRSHMAKMMVNYAKEVLGKAPDTALECNFTDVANESAELQGYIKEACQMGLMGVGITAFNPNGVVTRAQFGTVLSRALWGDKYDGADPYYADHLAALQDAGIMNNIDNPNALEIRGYVMLMMQRADETSLTPEICNTPENVLSCSLGLDTCPAECQTVSEEKAGSLNISVNTSNSPANLTSIPYNGTVKFATVDLSAGDSDVSVYGFELTRKGLGQNSDIYRVYFEKDGLRISSKGSVGTDDGVVAVGFTSPLTVKAGQKESVDLYVEMNANSGALGGEHKFVSTKVDSSAQDVAGSIDTPTLRTSNYSVPNIDITKVGSDTSYNVDSTKLVDLASFKIANTNFKELTFKSITLNNAGTSDLSYLKDLAIYRNEEKVSTNTVVNGRDVTFSLNNSIKNTAGTATYVVKGIITDAERENDTYVLSIKKIENVNVIETSTAFKTKTILNSVTTQTTLNFQTDTVKSADVKFNQTALSTYNKSVVPGSVDVVFYEWSITAKSAVMLENLTLTIDATGAVAADTEIGDFVRTFYLKIGSSSIAGTVTTTDNHTGTVTFDGTVNVNGTVPFKIVADIKDSAAAGSIKFNENVNLSMFKGTNEFVSNGQSVTSSMGSIAPIKITTTAAALQLDNSIKSTKTVVPGERMIDIAAPTFTTNTDITVKVTSFKLDMTSTAGLTGHRFDGGTVSLYDNAGGMLASDTINSGDTQLTFNNLALRVVKGTPVALTLKLDQVYNTTVSGDNLTFVMTGVEAYDLLTSNQVYPSPRSISGATIAVRGTTSINVSTNTLQNNLLQSLQSARIGSVKFTSQNGSSTLKKLVLALSGTTTTDMLSSIYLSGVSATVTKTGAGLGTIEFTDISNEIPAGETRTYDVYATINNFSSYADLSGKSNLGLILDQAQFETAGGTLFYATSTGQKISATNELTKAIPQITAIAGSKGSNYASFKVSLKAVNGDVKLTSLTLALAHNLSASPSGTVTLSSDENNGGTQYSSVAYSAAPVFNLLTSPITVQKDSTVDLYVTVQGVTWSNSGSATPYINVGLTDLNFADVFSDGDVYHLNALSKFKSALTSIVDLSKNIQ